MFPRRKASLQESSKWAFDVVALLVACLGTQELQSSLFCQGSSLSTQFTGIGAVEHSVQFLVAAANKYGLHFGCHVRWGCDKDERCQEYMARKCGGQHCMFKDILDLISDGHTMNHDSFHGLDIFLKVKLILSLMRNSHAWCFAHKRVCPLTFTTIAIAGSPCIDHSRIGSRAGLEGRTFLLLLVWLAFHRSAHTPLLLHENVKGFPVWIMRLIMGDMYWVYELEVDTWHVGFGLVRRPRILIVMLHKVRILLFHDILGILHMVFAHLSVKKTVALDCWGAFKEEFQQEFLYLASTRKHLAHLPCEALLKLKPIDILNDREKIVRLECLDKCAQSGCDLRGITLHLGDSTSYNDTSGLRDGIMPTLRRGGGLMWAEGLGRWLAASELFAAMGFAVTSELADAAHVPQYHLPGRHGKEAKALLGNSMCVPAMGTVIAVVLACTRQVC